MFEFIDAFTFRRLFKLSCWLKYIHHIYHHVYLFIYLLTYSYIYISFSLFFLYYLSYLTLLACLNNMGVLSTMVDVLSLE